MNALAALRCAIIAIVPLAGCAVTQGYPGAARPDGEISAIYFHSAGPITLSSMAVDGVSQRLFDAGFTVLPGKHTFSVVYNTDDSECSEHPCFVTPATGTCRGDFGAEAGREYIIDVVSGGYNASATIYSDNRRTVIGSGDCD
jgi:hypothetical protein